MARFSRMQVLNTIYETGIVPLFYHNDAETCKQVVKAGYKGGIHVFEFTNRGDYAHEVFAELNKWASKECPGLILGVGSIVEEGTTSLYIQLGANFIVSSLLNPGMAKICNRRKIAWIPGCATVTEINLAEELGAEIVKIFPAGEVGGPAFVKNIKGPCPWTSIIATGGVSPEHDNLKAWFDAGVSCVGMGSQLFSADIIKNKKFGEITKKVREALDIIKQLKKKA